MSALVERIWQLQQNRESWGPEIAAASGDTPHGNKALLIGCVDARINPRELKDKNGFALFPQEVFLERNIAARAVGPDAPGGGAEEAKLLRKALKGQKINRIVVMGHTHCGGIDACMHDKGGPHLMEYLQSLAGVREKVSRGGDNAATLRQLEIESVRDSVKNLMKHAMVQEAVAAGKLTIQPCLLNTATGEVMDVRPENPHFTGPEGVPPEHKPKMLIICGNDSDLLPQNELHLANGEAIIYRTESGAVLGRQAGSLKEAAVIEFALAKGVEDIVVLGKARADEPVRARADKQDAIWHSKQALESYPEVRAALEKNHIHTHGWLLDEKRMLRSVNSKGMFGPMPRPQGPQSAPAFQLTDFTPGASADRLRE